MGRQEQDLGREPVPHDRVCDCEAAELGQLVVEQHDIGSVFFDLGKGIASIAGLGDDLHPARRGQRPHDALTEHRVIVHDDHSHALWCL